MRIALKPELKFYKIKDKTTGLFSSGGCFPTFGDTGKTWTSRGDLKRHLTQLNCSRYDWAKGKYVPFVVPETWVVVEYLVRTEPSSEFSAAEEAARPAKK